MPTNKTTLDGHFCISRMSSMNDDGGYIHIQFRGENSNPRMVYELDMPYAEFAKALTSMVVKAKLEILEHTKNV